MIKVLVVEDEPLVRELAFEELTEEGLDVSAASTGDEAFVILQAGPAFDLLFTDIRMPGTLDGWALGQAARSHNPALRIIYTTGYSELKGELTENERFLKKPYRMGQVMDMIRSLGLPCTER